MKRRHQCPSLNPSRLHFDFLATDDFVPMYQSHIAHFVIKGLNQLGIAKWFIINMHTTFGVPFLIFLVHQNAC